MTTVETICSEIKSLEGALGAFVWHQSRCVASSLPKDYNSVRLGQAGSGLWRTIVLARTAGYSGSPSVFHWERASLYGWSIGDERLFGIVTMPEIARGMFELGATACAESLERFFAPTSPGEATVAPRKGGPGVPIRLAHLERALTGELGPAGRLLLDRSVRRAWQPGVPENIWLPRLRAVVLAEVEDIPTRERLGASPWWG